MSKHFIVVLFLFSLTGSLHAQLCTGSLGDPVVNITFGNAFVPNGPLKSGVTNLKYTTSACPNDGEYTITNSSFGCFNNSWFIMVGDHTRDDGGRYMLINASFDPSDFYVDTVSGLCGNTTYEFASWIVNVMIPTACGGHGIKPNLTFRIETTTGTVLKKFDTGDLPFEDQKVWKQYGTFFNTPPGVGTVVLRITNNAKGGCGNDLALDDITFRPCGPKITTYVNSDSARNNIYVCENEEKDFHFTSTISGGFTEPVLQWQISLDTARTWQDIPGEQTTTYTRKPTKGGQYQYRIVIADRTSFTSPQCRIASRAIIITVNPSPDPQINKRLLGCTGSDVRLSAVEGPTLSYQWSGPNGFKAIVRDPVLHNAAYSDSGLYKVLIGTNAGCTRTDTVNLSLLQGARAMVHPSASICEGTSIGLTASGGVKYVWTPATDLSNAHVPDPVATPKDTTVYQVKVTNQYGCSDSVQTTVAVWKKPIANAGPDRKIFEGQSVALAGSLTGTGVSFYWSPTFHMTNSNTITPTVNPVDNTTYTLYAVSDSGCGMAAGKVLVKVFKKVVTANVFSPNGDGINDTWVIKGLDSYPESELSLFNRTGQLVFQSKGYAGGWDGTYKGRPLPVGTYYYLIDLKMGLPVISGWVLIVR